MCNILPHIKRIVNHSKTFNSVKKVINAICSKGPAASILYEWPDLCLFFFNLFLDYISFANMEYPDYYPREWEETLVLFGKFMQVYESYLGDNLEARGNILLALQGMRKSELQMQLFIILDHYTSVHPYQCYDPSAIGALSRRNSFKMLAIHLCDKLLRNYSESTMKQLQMLHDI
jgi:hypothetical protein